jgi:DNA-binding HxlR family transcriptional regulator
MTCTIARSVDVIGDPLTIMIMKELFLGQRRFGDIQMYTGMSPHLLSVRMHLLSVRMKKLEKEGVVQRRQYQQRLTRYEYRLTEKGIDLWPILVAFKDWSARWGRWSNGEPLTIRHKACSHVTAEGRLLLLRRADQRTRCQAGDVDGDGQGTRSNGQTSKVRCPCIRTAAGVHAYRATSCGPLLTG